VDIKNKNNLPWYTFLASRCEELKSIFAIFSVFFMISSSAVLYAKSYVNDKVRRSHVEIEQQINNQFKTLCNILSESGPNFKEAVEKVKAKDSITMNAMGIINDR